ncbi:AAA family ATPase [Primorskyibacter sp. S187A]|uniref:AAA family ATPase n=1 Tax=Primorskyibacter sp. S187A TaxID=3415130 RepID=UPI003C79AC94
MILGQPGAGKSTLARSLGEITGLPVVHVDKIHWMSGWVERAKEEKIALALQEQSAPRWIFEGGLAATKEDRLNRADMLIVLDIPFALRVWRVAKRTVLYYGRTRPDLPEDCPERFSAEFWAWIWNTRKTGRRNNLQWASRARELGKRVVILSSPAMVRRFLKTLDAEWNSRQ